MYVAPVYHESILFSHCSQKHGGGIVLLPERKWRNWYTRYFEVVVRVTSWGFKSPLSQSSLHILYVDRFQGSLEHVLRNFGLFPNLFIRLQ